MDGKEDEEEEDGGETWLVSSHGGEKTRWAHGLMLI
jgi:hypothetical protein